MFKADLHQCSDIISGFLFIRDHSIRFNNTGRFHFADTVDHGGYGQMYLLTDIGSRLSCIFFQFH